MNAPSGTRTIPDRHLARWPQVALSWEAVLVLLLAVVFVANSLATPYFLDPWNLSYATFNFTEKAIIALAMALLIIAGDIDLSVASIIAVASVAMGACAAVGMPTPVIVAAGLGTGLLAGCFNGFVVTAFGVPSIIVTIGTMSLYRGIAYIVLGDQAYREYPESFDFFGQGYVWSYFSFELCLFIALAIAFGVLLHATSFGRRTFAIGNNPLGARFAGIDVERHRFVLFALSGLMAGLAAVLLTSRIGSTRPNIAFAWELEVVTMVVLGGVSILGGAGSILGVVLSVLVIGAVTFGLTLLNVPGVVLSIFVGLLLILAIAMPRAVRAIASRFQQRGAEG